MRTQGTNAATFVHALESLLKYGARGLLNLQRGIPVGTYSSISISRLNLTSSSFSNTICISLSMRYFNMNLFMHKTLSILNNQKFIFVNNEINIVSL